MNDLLIDKLVVACGCGLALYAYFGRKGLPASILAVVISWLFKDVAIGIGGGILALYLILNVINKIQRNTEDDDENEEDIIDVEFSVVEKK